MTSSLPQLKSNNKNIKKVINEDIDFDSLFYCYTSILNKSENEFWESTPMKLKMLIKLIEEVEFKENDM